MVWPDMHQFATEDYGCYRIVAKDLIDLPVENKQIGPASAPPASPSH